MTTEPDSTRSTRRLHVIGQCEYIPETEPSVLRLLLKVKPGLGEGYNWVERGACGAGWQVPHYAESGW